MNPNDRPTPTRRSRVIVREDGTLTVYEGSLPRDVAERINAALSDGTATVSFQPHEATDAGA